MRILVVDNAEAEHKDFTMPLIEGLSEFADLVVVSYRELPPAEEIATYDGVVLSGSPPHYSFDIIDTRLPSVQWVTSIDIPVLGICLGHQNIGRLHGADLIKNDEAENGLEPITLHADDPLLTGVRSGDLVAAHHRGSVTLPEDFILLGSTPKCRIHIMKHATKDIYGVQFHAELSEAGLKLLRNFVDIAAARALARSRSEPPQEEMLLDLSLGVEAGQEFS